MKHSNESDGASLNSFKGYNIMVEEEPQEEEMVIELENIATQEFRNDLKMAAFGTLPLTRNYN